MEIYLLKVTCKKLINFNEEAFNIDFISEKRVSVVELENNIVTQLFNNIYKLNTLEFIGINASGKTTTINILSSILNIYIGNKSLSSSLKLTQFFEKEIEIETYYFDKRESCIYKLVSHINKGDEVNALYFEEEELYSKPIHSQITKKNIFDFKGIEPQRRSEIDNDFLKQEDSMFSGIINKKKNRNMLIFDMCHVTGHNYLTAFNQELVMNYIQYLDPSIEKFQIIETKSEDTSKPKFRIRFRNSQQDIEVGILNLDEYLSAGTIKGIALFSMIFPALKTGGYLLVDEIENHFNKTIVTNVIRMFNSELNIHGATLLFTTHYSEILDTIDRSDSIYVLNKDEKIRIEKFSKLAGEHDRIDKKKSDVILSGLLHTAPKYSAYRKLHELFKRRLEGDEKDDRY